MFYLLFGDYCSYFSLIILQSSLLFFLFLAHGNWTHTWDGTGWVNGPDMPSGAKFPCLADRGDGTVFVHIGQRKLEDGTAESTWGGRADENSLNMLTLDLRLIDYLQVPSG